MLVSVGIVKNGFLLNRFLGDCEVDNDGPIVRRGGENRKLKSGECFAGITVSFLGEVAEGIRVGFDFHLTKASFFVIECALEEGDKVVCCNGFELEDLGSGD